MRNVCYMLNNIHSGLQRTRHTQSGAEKSGPPCSLWI